MDLLNKLILGTVQFGLDYGINNISGKVSMENSLRILSLAQIKGIQLLDTAQAYGNATEVIGNYHQQNLKFDVITKFKSGHTNIEDLNQELGDILTTLGINCVFGYLYHSFSDFKRFTSVRTVLKELRQKGMIKHIGVSIYTTSELEELIEDDFVEIIQLPYNLLDNSLEKRALLKKAKAKEKIIHVRSVFLQGLFFKKADDLSPNLYSLHTALKSIQDIANRHSISMAQLALSYAFSNKDIDGVLIGVDSEAQLQSNIDILDTPLTEEIIREIESIHIADKTLLNPSNWS